MNPADFKSWARDRIASDNEIEFVLANHIVTLIEEDYMLQIWKKYWIGLMEAIY